MPKESERELSSSSARIPYLVCVMGRDVDVAVKEGLALVCAVAAVSVRTRPKQSGGLFSHNHSCTKIKDGEKKAGRVVEDH